MSRGYRGLVVAAFGWLILAAAPAPNNSAETEQANSAQRTERSLESIAAAQNQIAESTDTGEYQQPCGDGEYDNRSDLCAQWHAANAARDAADWAFYALAVGGAGAVGIVVALLLTIQSNSIARDTARRQLRAYLAVGSAALDERIQSGRKAAAEFKIVNCGETPAYKVRAGSKAVILEADAQIFIKPPADSIATMEIGPDQHFFLRCSDGPVTVAQMGDIKHERSCLYVAVSVDYEDAFGRPQTFRALYKNADLQHLAPAVIHPVEHGNEGNQI